MKKKWLPIVAVTFLLSGCWDEELFKNESIVDLVGYEGTPGEITGYYAYPLVSKDNIEYMVITGKGKSLHDVRLEVNKETDEILNIAPLEVALMSDETATHDLYKYLDPFYRIPKNRLNARLAIVEGSVADYINEDLNLTANMPDFYRGLLESSLFTSEAEDVTLQKACTLLFDSGIDLTLPYLVMNEESEPKLGGSALFSKNIYTGQHLTTAETVLMRIMKDEVGKYARQTYMWEHKGEKYPLVIDVEKVSKKWDIKKSGDTLKLTANYNLKVAVSELAIPHVTKKDTIKELEKFINKKMEEDMSKVFEKIQDVKSDALGIGRKVRAFHPDIWEVGDWHDTYKKMEFDVHVKSTVYSTGLLK